MRRINRTVWLVCIVGLLVRLGFLLVGAKIYFNRPNIFVDGDTSAWASSFENLFRTGTYTLNPASEYGYFGRMPGYSFFIGIFYLLCGQHWQRAFEVIGWFQTLLDVFAIVLVYKIALRLFASDRAAAVTAWLYALYPFVMVWTPVVYSEYMSIFILLAAMFYLTHPEKRFYYGWVGALLGVGALFRPQLLLLMPLVGIYLLYKYRRNAPLMLSRAAVFGLMILLTFGWWPARNVVFHGKPIITQDLRGANNWNVDVLGFMQYIYAVKAEWEPQFSEIIKNKNVELPPAAFAVKEDSADVRRVIELSKTCGSGFSHWKGYWKETFDQPNCNAEIAALYNKLRADVVRHDPFRYYVTLPLQNMQKAMFKISLTDANTPARKAAGLLFMYRTLLLMLGLFGCIGMIWQRHHARWFAWVVLGFFALVYVSLCAGTGPQFRNIEMRYFIHPDILLLFPAAWLLVRLFTRKTVPAVAA